MVQIGLRVQAVGLGRFQHSKDRGAGVGPGLCVAEQPILASDHNGTDGVLYLVIADLDLAVVKEGAKILPLVQGVGDGLFQLAGRAENGFQPSVVLINNGHGEELTLFPAFFVNYINVFQLKKFISGKHKEWKPAVFELLGYNSDFLKQEFALNDELDEVKVKSKNIRTEMSVGPDDYDKIKSILDLRIEERDEMQKRIDAFSFFAEDQRISQKLVDEIESSISELNTREYTLSFDLDRIKASIENLPTFEIEQLKQIYEEVKIHFPDNLAHSFEDIQKFNIQVTKERNQYLQEQSNEIEEELRSVRLKLQELDKKRNEALSVLQDRDSFHKFKEYQKKLAQLEGDVSRLEIQLKNVDLVSSLTDDIERIQQKQKDISKEIASQLKNQDGDIPLSIKRHFNEIFRTIFGVSALLYVRPNKTGNVDFLTEVAPDENAEATAEGDGNTYYKMLCVAFDLAILATYSQNNFFRFVYHDGVFEGLDNRKKELFVKVARDYCHRYGLQYIFSSIEDDIPQTIMSGFTDKERFLTLSDQDDSGKLFGFSF